MKSLALASMCSAALAFGAPASLSTAHAQQTSTTAEQDSEKAKREADQAGAVGRLRHQGRHYGRPQERHGQMHRWQLPVLR